MTAASARSLDASESLPPRNADPRRSAGPWIVVGLLCMNVAIVAGTIAFAMSGSTLQVQAGWDHADRTWDERQAAARAQRELGWRVEASASGDGLLRIALRDRAGAPLDRARVRAEAFHAGHPGAPRTLGFEETAPGAYAASLAGALPGRWVLRVEALRGAQTLRHECEVEVARESSNP
jgi:nitrogen fixation protein FixH